MYDRVNDKGLFLKGSQTGLPATEEKKSPLYLFVWLPREDTGLSATGGSFFGCGDKTIAASRPHQSQPLDWMQAFHSLLDGRSRWSKHFWRGETNCIYRLLYIISVGDHSTTVQFLLNHQSQLQWIIHKIVLIFDCKDKSRQYLTTIDLLWYIWGLH